MQAGGCIQAVERCWNVRKRHSNSRYGAKSEEILPRWIWGDEHLAINYWENGWIQTPKGAWECLKRTHWRIEKDYTTCLERRQTNWKVKYDWCVQNANLCIVVSHKIGNVVHCATGGAQRGAVIFGTQWNISSLQCKCSGNGMKT